MNNNLNGISNNIEPEKSNKGVKVLLIVVAILLLALLLLLGYKFLILDKKDTTNNNNDNNKVVENNNELKEELNADNEKTGVNDNNTITNNNSNTNSKTENVAIKDTFALEVDEFNGGVSLYYYALNNGKVYELVKQAKNRDTNYAYYYSTKLKNEFSSDAVNEEVILKEVKGLPTIKRIKGTVSVGSDASMGILLVAENGEVYIYTISGGNKGNIEKAKFLDNYKVDDVISYYAESGCTGGPSVKTCGGEYNIVDQNGKTHHYRVNTDGTLTKK